MKAPLLVLASILIALLLCEAGLRMFTRFGPQAATESFATSGGDKPVNLDGAKAYIDRLPAAPGTNRSWFTDNPPPLPNRKPVDIEEERRYRDYERRGLFGPQADYVWNRLYAESTACAPVSVFHNYPDRIMVFDPPSRTNHPIYRFPANVTTTAGLVTNQWGFRGPPIDLVKPARTVRVAFIGASTTVNSHDFPYSYPERTVYWLNRYAQENHLDVRFEVINAGREGINSEDIPAIVDYEVLPLNPDLVVYYEGANQFPSANQLVTPPTPPRKQLAPNDPIVTHKVPDSLRAYFAIANLVDAVLRGFRSIGEPVKPAYRLRWPIQVDERNPNPDNPSLPLQLPVIVRNLDTIRTSLKPSRVQFVVCSFNWFTPQDIPLSPARHRFIYEQLNTVLWPLRYSDIRRLADFQNRVFRRYAESRDLPFLDVASQVPKDPNFFVDAIHMTDTGERVKAWIVFQQLVPLLRQELDSGQLPRSVAPSRLPPDVPVSEMSLRCDQEPSGKITKLENALSIYRREISTPGAAIDLGPPLKITTTDRQWAYAVSFPIDLARPPEGRIYGHLRARVLLGQAGMAILDQQSNSFIVDRSIPVSPNMADLYFAVPYPERASALVIRNAAPDGVRSQVEIESMELLVVSSPNQK